MTEKLHFHFSFSCIGEGNGNPLQYSCLGNPMNEGAWQATVHGEAKKIRFDFKQQQPDTITLDINLHHMNWGVGTQMCSHSGQK